MTKLLIGLLGAGVLATGGWAAATGLESDPARTVSLPGATTSDDTTTSATTTGATMSGTTTGTRTTTEDISGPCDEAEHRNDPRCTGATVDDDHRGGDDDGDDNSGHGSGGDDHEDRSGSNSGSG